MKLIYHRTDVAKQVGSIVDRCLQLGQTERIKFSPIWFLNKWKTSLYPIVNLKKKDLPSYLLFPSRLTINMKKKSIDEWIDDEDIYLVYNWSAEFINQILCSKKIQPNLFYS